MEKTRPTMNTITRRPACPPRLLYHTHVIRLIISSNILLSNNTLTSKNTTIMKAFTIAGVAALLAADTFAQVPLFDTAFENAPTTFKTISIPANSITPAREHSGHYSRGTVSTVYASPVTSFKDARSLQKYSAQDKAVAAQSSSETACPACYGRHCPPQGSCPTIPENNDSPRAGKDAKRDAAAQFSAEPTLAIAQNPELEPTLYHGGLWNTFSDDNEASSTRALDPWKSSSDANTPWETTGPTLRESLDPLRAGLGPKRDVVPTSLTTLLPTPTVRFLHRVRRHLG